MEDKNPTIQISEMDFQTAQHNFFFFFLFFHLDLNTPLVFTY